MTTFRGHSKTKALKSNDFKAFVKVETVGLGPMTSTLPV